MKCLLLLLRELLTLDSSVVSTCVFNAIDGWHIIFFSCPVFVLGFFGPSTPLSLVQPGLKSRVAFVVFMY